MDNTNSVNFINNCSLSGICGGCFYASAAGESTDACVNYQAQLDIKNNHVKGLLDEAVAQFGGGAPYIYEGIVSSPLVFGYRNKMEYSFGDCTKDGPLTLGLHQKKSFYNVIDVDCCNLVHNDCNLIVKAAAEYFRELKLTYTDKRSHLGFLRYLIIRRAVNTGEMLIDLITTSQPAIPVEKHSDIYDVSLYKPSSFEDTAKAGIETEKRGRGRGRGSASAIGSLMPIVGQIEAADGVSVLDTETVIRGFADRMIEVGASEAFAGKIRGVLHTVNDTLADAVRNDGTTVLYGEDHIQEELLGLKFDISPFSFFQTNSKGAEVLYSKVREYITGELRPDMSVYDLYSGTGTIAQMLAPCVREVTGVEIIEEAVEAARVNATYNGLDNCKFIADDVFRALDSLPAPDVIILDPPRDGVNPKALRKIIDYKVKNMIYVSCKPESLARDLAMLQGAGYRLVKATAVDQFPWTKNVESVVLLSRTEGTQKEG